MIHAHIVISGRVHGVSFRRGAKSNADHLGLSGWAKNLKSGDIEIEVEGDSINVNRFLDWCKHGPMLARVDNVVVTYAQVQGFESFRIVR